MFLNLSYQVKYGRFKNRLHKQKTAANPEG